jgi:antitoxin component of RelBE/YafQ-DinJ toxin-antitoxin module
MMAERIAALAAREGVDPDDVRHAADEIAEHLGITPDEALDAMTGDFSRDGTASPA